MKRSVLLLVVGGMLASASGVSADDGVLEAAERAMAAASAGTGVALQDVEPRRRSMKRTWGGVGLIAGGILTATRTYHKTCRSVGGSPWTCETKRPAVAIGAGIGMAALGVLLTTEWSDVPVARSVDVSATPDGFGIAKTFGF